MMPDTQGDSYQGIALCFRFLLKRVLFFGKKAQAAPLL